MVQLQFSTERAIDSAIIRWLTWSDVSHVDFVLTSSTGTEHFLGARVMGGVQIREAGYSRCHHVKRATVDVPDAPVLVAAASQLGKPYDWRGIFNFTRQRNWRKLDSWFCSELIAWAFEEAGFPLLNIGAEVWRVTPRDLLLSPMVIVEAH